MKIEDALAIYVLLNEDRITGRRLTPPGAAAILEAERVIMDAARRAISLHMASLVTTDAPQMRFKEGEIAILARLPPEQPVVDPENMLEATSRALRLEAISRRLGERIEILKVESNLYVIATSMSQRFFVSDGMLDPVVP